MLEKFYKQKNILIKFHKNIQLKYNKQFNKTNKLKQKFIGKNSYNIVI